MSQELEGTLTNEINLVGTFGETGGGTTNYNDLINKPSINNVTLQGNKTGSQLGLVSSTDLATVATTGSYNDLINKPTIPAAQVNSDWNASSGVAEILNKPTLAAVATSGAYSDLTGTPTLAAVATSGDYDDLTNKPSIPAAQVNADWNSTSGVSEILNKPTIPAAQVNSDWNASSGVAEILNKPTVYQNAAELPISSSDPTDTKSYIDTGLSGKADKALTNGTVTAFNTNIDVRRYQLKQFGNIKLLQLVFVPAIAVAENSRIATLSIPTTETNVDIIGVDKDGNGRPFYITDDTIYVNSNLTANKAVFINSWYI